jgi:hypothetical protein
LDVTTISGFSPKAHPFGCAQGKLSRKSGRVALDKSEGGVKGKDVLAVF